MFVVSILRPDYCFLIDFIVILIISLFVVVLLLWDLIRCFPWVVDIDLGSHFLGLLRLNVTDDVRQRILVLNFKEYSTAKEYPEVKMRI